MTVMVRRIVQRIFLDDEVMIIVKGTLMFWPDNFSKQNAGALHGEGYNPLVGCEGWVTDCNETHVTIEFCEDDENDTCEWTEVFHISEVHTTGLNSCGPYSRAFGLWTKEAFDESYGPKGTLEDFFS